MSGRNKSPSRYEQLQNRNVIDLQSERVVRLGKVEVEIVDGKATDLEVILPDGRPINLLNLLLLPNLYQGLAEAFLEWTKTPDVSSYATKYTLSRNIVPFVEFLVDEQLTQIEFNDLTVSHINGFVAWLDDQPNRGRPWSEDTRRDKLGAVRTLLEIYRLMHPGVLQRDFYVPNGQWVGAAYKANHTPALPGSEWDALHDACLSEVTSTMEIHEETLELVAEGADRIPQGKPKRGVYLELPIFLASMNAAYPVRFPTAKQVTSDNNLLGRALIQVHGASSLQGFYPSPKTLVPFVLLMALYTLFNATPLLNLLWSNIEYRNVLGTPRVIIRGYKARSKRNLERSFALDPKDPYSPGEILLFLKSWTARLRPELDPIFQDRVFIFASNQGKPGDEMRARGFGLDKMGSTHDNAWKYNVRNFLADHDLAVSGVRQIRATGLDVIHSLFSGDIRAVVAAAGHSSGNVSDRYYTSGTARSRNDQSLAGVMVTHERYARTGGRIDPRGTPAHGDIFAATPGAICADPYDSPFAITPKPIDETGGISNAQLCDAYGMCWNCPLLQLHFSSPYQFARAIQFKEELVTARGYLPAARWKETWRPVLTNLEKHIIPRFTDPAVITRAKALLPRLAGIPQVD